MTAQPFSFPLPQSEFLRILKLFGWGRSADEDLDADDVAQRLKEGLNEVSDADARSTGEGRHYRNLDDMTVEDAETARRIADALDKRRR